ncbi:ubiquinone/menaquinone biosynthesis methyltransferase [Dissulfurirhabdus thermomarina]|uniref:Demethylmenaquinone methyltransferase n=1 Tax=Dissulfurirhabdus thermomarina TaxID=1765737 RepID=A0A6N9TQE0_DISTH|nr:ubiquinone/menaquinone biosynthesis methyltransferase [Dissulfurirhabdus thermomarina]NDY43492.1 ubiquinone/menaquinone biosynthesis methyltransferase [Dissulfurirhabdus thermomarina]NMX23359.1 ubiquinone/menaquinone biosynthesis methyltransferase [Dissulfurirhabdus thermomarina]
MDVPAGPEKRSFVRRKFAAVTGRYDLLNTLLSLGIDRRWRRAAALEAAGAPPGPVLDLCAGTLPLSAAIVRAGAGPVAAVDFCLDMLREGTARMRRRPEGARIHPACGDGERLPLADASVAAVTVAFGVRNLADLRRGLAEMHRVLVPGGKAVILEFSRPENPAFAPLYRFYLHRVLPAVAGAISGDAEAYRYLADSIEAFASPAELAALMEAAGFRDVRCRPLTLGVVTLTTAWKEGR